MCGIVGLVGAVRPEQRDCLAAMRDAMRHRGPDDEGLWWSADGRVGLGHRRLAIVDVTPAGHQPMSDGGDLHVVFNGEIYNHRELRRTLESRGHAFASHSDTEVLLKAYREWGEQCLERFDGMYAFALYDARVRRLLLARDPAGERPLFYRWDRGLLSFASEPKALLADPAAPRRLDRDAFAFYLAYGYVPGERCMLDGMRKLPAGHVLTLDLTGAAMAVRRYWEPPRFDERYLKASLDDLATELELRLMASVRRQLQADVPVGVLLSGGLDSSLVTALAARASATTVRTFTVRFPGAAAYDEGPFARLVADHFGTDHTELVAEPAHVDLLPLLARQFDEPIADSSLVPTYLVTRQIRTSATVALGGDGGDELFGGYPHYSWLAQLERVRPMVPAAVSSGIGRAATRLPAGTRGRNHLIGLASRGSGIAHVNVYFDRVSRATLSPWLRAERSGAPECFRASLCADRPTVVQQATATDFLTTMVDGYLVKVDKASMLNSLEVRAPFLARDVVEFAFGQVADAAKVRGPERKILLRHLGARLLPPTLDLRRKQGFSMPLADWFQGAWGAYVAEVLRAADNRLFDPAAVERLIEGQRRGYANTARLFSLTMFELWRREYRVAIA